MKLVRPLMVLSAAAFLAAPATQLVSSSATTDPVYAPVVAPFANSQYPSLSYGWAGGPGVTTSVTAMSGAPLTINVKQALSGGCSATAFTGVSPNQSATIVAPAGTIINSSVGSYTVIGLSAGQRVTVNIADTSGNNKCVEVVASIGTSPHQISSTPQYAPFLNIAKAAQPPALYTLSTPTEDKYSISIPSNYTEQTIMRYQVTSCTLAQYLKANNVCDASTTAVQTEPLETDKLTSILNGSSEIFPSSSATALQGFVPGELHSLSVNVYPDLGSTQASLSAPPLYTNSDLGIADNLGATQVETYAALSNGSATDTLLVAHDLTLKITLSAAGITNDSLQPSGSSNTGALKDTLYGPIQATNTGCPSGFGAYASAPAQNTQIVSGSSMLAATNPLQADVFTTASVALGSHYGCYIWRSSYAGSNTPTLESFDYEAPAVVTPPPPPALPTPSVTSLTPEYGPVAGGTTVTITGSNLNGASAVDFGSEPSTIVSDTSSQIVVTDPAHTAGPVSVTVHAADGDVTAGNFTYIPAPVNLVTPPVKKTVTPPVKQVVTPPAKVVQKTPAPVKVVAPVSVEHPVKHGISIVTGTGTPIRRDAVPPVVPVALVGTGLLLAGIARKTQKAAR